MNILTAIALQQSLRESPHDAGASHTVAIWTVEPNNTGDATQHSYRIKTTRRATRTSSVAHLATLAMTGRRSNRPHGADRLYQHGRERSCLGATTDADRHNQRRSDIDSCNRNRSPNGGACSFPTGK